MSEMTEAQEKAWGCLTQLEQQALYLQIIHGKTSWEVGEILNMSHYKYLELKERSHKFFTLFTHFFEKYTAIFNPMTNAEETFRDYIEATIEKRYSKKQARVYIGDSTHLIPKISKKGILRNMGKMKNSKSQWDRDTFALIQEFDRWNSFRILPEEYQLLSPYRRRVNKKFKIYLKWVMKIKPFVVERIREKFNTKASIDVLYVCLTSYEKYGSKGYEVIKVQKDPITIKELSRLRIYTWEEYEQAESFGIMASIFAPKTKNIKMGLKFWPDYRELIQKATNFQNINPSNFTKYGLDLSHDSYT